MDVTVTIERPRVDIDIGSITKIQLGYQRLWPLADWATVDAGLSGVTYTEHADGIQLTIPPGPADLTSPHLAWRASGPVSAIIPQLQPSPSWWSLQALGVIMERVPPSNVGGWPGIWAGIFFHCGEAFDQNGTHGAMLEYSPDVGYRRVGYIYQDGSWLTGTAAAGSSRGVALDLPDAYTAASRRIVTALGLTAEGDFNGSRTTSLATLPWDFSVEPWVSIVVGRTHEGAAATLRIAPQVMLQIASLAQEGTP